MMRANVVAVLRQLWRDDSGAVLTAEYLTLGSVVVLGGVSGLAAMRDSMNTEMREYGNAVRQIRQSYSVPGYQTGAASVSGSAAADLGGSPSQRPSGYANHWSGSGGCPSGLCDMVP